MFVATFVGYNFPETGKIGFHGYIFIFIKIRIKKCTVSSASRKCFSAIYSLFISDYLPRHRLPKSQSIMQVSYYCISGHLLRFFFTANTSISGGYNKNSCLFIFALRRLFVK